MPHAPGQLPLLLRLGVDHFVLGRAEVAVARLDEGQPLAPGRDETPQQLDEIARPHHHALGQPVTWEVRFHPAVVDHAVGHPVVVVGDQLRQVAAARPRDVVPQHRRLVAVDELADVRRDVLAVAAVLRRGQHGVARPGQDGAVVGPVVAARVVEAHAHAPGPHRGAQVTDEVTPRLVAPLTGCATARPQREAVVVLGRQHDVTGSGRAAQVGQRVEVGLAAGVVERRHEVLVGVVVPVHLAVVPLRRAARQPHGVEVPLGVGVLEEHPLRPVLREHLLDVGHLRRPARHRVEAPVHEDAQLGVVIPVGHHVGAHRVPCPLIHGRCRFACDRPSPHRCPRTPGAWSDATESEQPARNARARLAASAPFPTAWRSAPPDARSFLRPAPADSHRRPWPWLPAGGRARAARTEPGRGNRPRARPAPATSTR